MRTGAGDEMTTVEKKKLDESGRNKYLYFLMIAISTIAGAFCSEGYFQTYLVKLGASSSDIGLFGFFSQLAMLVSYMLLTTISPYQKGIMLRYSISTVALAVLPFGFWLSGIFYGNMYVALAIALIAIVTHAAVSSYKSTVEFSIVPFLFPRKSFGFLSSASAVVGGIVTAGFAFFLGNTSSETPFPGGYMRLFLIATLGSLVSASLTFFFSMKKPDKPEDAPQISYKDVLKRIVTAKYIKLLIPHFLRGIGMAGLYFFMPVALLNINLSDREQTMIVFVSVLAGMCGNLIFMSLASRIRSGVLTLLSNIICAVSLIIIGFNRSNLLFFIIFGVYTCFNIISQISIPTGVLRSTPDEDLPLISSLRMLIVSATSSVCILLFGLLLGFVSPFVVIMIGAAAFIVCGFLFFRRFTDNLV